MNKLLALAGITVLLMLVACRPQPLERRPSVVAGKDAPLVTWGQPCGGCRLGVNLTHVSAVAGEPVDINVTFENIGESSVALGPIPPGIPMGNLRVSAQTDGKQAAPTVYAKHVDDYEGSFQDLALPPASRIGTEVRLNRLVDLTASGNYTIRLSLAIGAGKKWTEACTVQSVPIEVRIIECSR